MRATVARHLTDYIIFSARSETAYTGYLRKRSFMLSGLGQTLVQGLEMEMLKINIYQVVLVLVFSRKVHEKF